MAKRKQLATWIKVIGVFIAIVVAFVFAGLLVALILYPPAYVYRVLAWRESDVDDYRYNFPQRPLKATNPAPLPEAYQTDRVAAVFAQQDGIDDLAQFLAANDTQAFLVLEDGAIIYENYFNGTEQDTPVTSFSVAKSWTSALVGRALGMEYDGWWSLDSEASGFEKMEAGLNGPARDFAKFGQLFLQNGAWAGEQVTRYRTSAACNL